MPQIERPDGARIYYEVHGEGFPLLAIAPGGVSSQVEIWQRSAIQPVRDFAGEFQVIAMDQRHAGRSPAPATPFSYAETAGDQLAVLDAVGAERAFVFGACIGCAHALRMTHDAPGRIAGAVCQDPVGLDETNNLGTFFAMFDETMRLARAEGMDAVVKAALENPIFMANHGAGPFSARIHQDPEFAEQIRRTRVESYIPMVVRFRDGVWPDQRPYFSVPETWVRTCPAPLLVLPGSDPFHRTGVAHKLCREARDARCLEVDCRGPDNLPKTLDEIRAFLRDHAA